MIRRSIGAVRTYLGLKRAAPRPYPEQFSPEMDLPRFEGTPRLYIIATTPRCGSHFVGHALARTGHFGVPLEYLNRRNLPSWHARFGAGDPSALLRALVAHRTSASGWFGLKAHWTQFEPFADMSVFAPFGGVDRALYIVRRDLLGQAISYVRADQTGQFISGSPKRGDSRYDHARILERARGVRDQNEAWSAFFADRFDRPLETLAYEDVLANQSEAFRTIGAFLDPGAAVVPTPSDRTQRQSDEISSDWRRAFHAEMRPEDRWILEPQRA